MKKLFPGLLLILLCFINNATAAEVLVKLKEGKSSLFRNSLSPGILVKEHLKLLTGNFLVLSSLSLTAEKLLTELSSDESIEYAEANILYQVPANFQGPRFRTEDELFPKLWGLLNTGENEPHWQGGYTGVTGVPEADIGAPKAWTLLTGRKDVIIAVLDTGIDYHHPDLRENMWANPGEIPANGIDDDKNGHVDDVHGLNAYANSGDPMDDNGHGTHCAGTIGAVHDNHIGVAGVMPHSKLMALKFQSKMGSGSLSDAVEAIDYAIRMGAQVINMSWGSGGATKALEEIIRLAGEKGILVAASAGNTRTNNDYLPNYPASLNLPNVISVAAHNHSDVLWRHSSYGENSVHIAAPGQNILSTTPGNTYQVSSGTSMATPHVAGILGLFKTQGEDLSPGEIRERLMQTGKKIPSYEGKVISGSRVDAYQFLKNL